MKRRMVFLLVLVCLLAWPVMAAAGKPGEVWYVPGDFATIQDALDSTDVHDGDTIRVGPGNHAGAYLSKAVTIKGMGGALIDDGPLHPAGLSQGFRILAGGSGATISHLRFSVDLAIMNGEAADDVTVTHCTFLNCIQGVSNWRGSGWHITHNKIVDLRTRCGGGIGILVGDYMGGVVEGNVVSHNTITGVLHVDPNDCGGYNGTGVALYADFRWGRAGAEEIKENRVVWNKVGLLSDTPLVVDVVAIELTDTRDDEELDCVIFDNAVGFNDLRRTELAIVLTPESLEDCNDISRNLGPNRGHGLHPSVFGPGP